MIFGVPITENDSFSLMFGIDSNQITTYGGYTPRAIIDYIDAIGSRTFHSWRTELGWARDTRNHALMPTAGTYQRLGLEATLPGSTAEYYKLSYQISKYWPIMPSLVVNTRAEIGYGDSYGKDTVRDICWKDIPAVPVFAPEYKKPEAKAGGREFTIKRMEAHVWSVDAPWLEYILAGSNVDDYESLQYFQRQLGESGILDALVQKGVQENDTILIGEYQFDYIF